MKRHTTRKRNRKAKRERLYPASLWHLWHPKKSKTADFVWVVPCQPGTRLPLGMGHGVRFVATTP